MFKKQREKISSVEVWKQYEIHGHTSKPSMLEIYAEHGILCLTNILVITQEQSLQVCRAEKDMETKLQEKPEHPFDFVLSQRENQSIKLILLRIRICLQFSLRWTPHEKVFYPTLAKRSIRLWEKETTQISVILSDSARATK
jgi:hypothetical protein